MTKSMKTLMMTAALSGLLGGTASIAQAARQQMKVPPYKIRKRSRRLLTCPSPELSCLPASRAFDPREIRRAVRYWTLTTLREQLIKIGAKAVRHARQIIFQMAEVAVPRELFRAILEGIRRLRLPAAASG